MCIATVCVCDVCRANNNPRVVIRVEFCPAQRLKNDSNLAPCAAVKYREVDDVFLCRMANHIHHPSLDISALNRRPMFMGHLQSCQGRYVPARNPSVSGSAVNETQGGTTQDSVSRSVNKPAFVAPEAIPSHRALPPLPTPDKAGRVVPAFIITPVNEKFRPDPKTLPAIVEESLVPDRPTAIASGIASRLTPEHPAAIGVNMASSFTPINKPAGDADQVDMPMKTTTPASDNINARTRSKTGHWDNDGNQATNAKTHLPDCEETSTSQGNMASEANKATSGSGSARTTAIKIKIINTRAAASMASNNNAGEPSRAGNASNAAAASEATGSDKSTKNPSTTSLSAANPTNPAATEEPEKKKRTPLPTSRPNTARVLHATAMAASAALVPPGGPWTYAETVRLLILRVRGLSTEEMALVSLSFSFRMWFIYFFGLCFPGLLVFASLACLFSFLGSCLRTLWVACLLLHFLLSHLPDSQVPCCTSLLHFPASFS